MADHAKQSVRPSYPSKQTSTAGRITRIMYGMNAVRLLGFVAVFDLIAIFILYPRLDVFSVGYLMVSTALAILQAAVSSQLSKSPELQRLFYAKEIDPAWDKWVAILGMCELGVFYEYAHLRLVQALLNAPLQTAGLALCILGTGWLLWVDAYLVRELPAHYRRAAPMMSGPYRLLRHPRYVGLLATRVGLPLVFGSLLAWALASVWFLLIRRRAHLEERYMTTKFGRTYRDYAQGALGMP
jgi:protein-S-isoprenylcysteine O-methyltransferase Ste14